ncbi:DUF4760 domain-containing protein [Glacieibacterium frigidum]|uniref:DUF4760 domain-containing protein n=1 Tax=Glacieibacterium frigidum TaxID=2593303 RepID=A0A552UIL7_9SPHN|nr:DUF4760 domain-containing protein [Glacieibacterium frigidum]TRW18054.1 DUF4760 domain-containing protein [Glacieibacterium frigidum]
MDGTAVPSAVGAWYTIVTHDAGAAFPYAFLLAPLATILGVCAAIFVARASIKNARDTARLKATLDLIEKAESSDFYLRINASFTRVRRENLFDRLDDPNDVDSKALRLDVGAYLNHYELVAIGIENRILDEAMYRLWMAGPFVRDWNAAADWIQRERWRRGTAEAWVYRDGIYATYQTVACRWSKEARRLVAGAPPVDTPDVPGGTPISPGDEPLPDTSGTPG